MTSLGQYLAYRLKEIGLNDYFAIPGDFNLELLDQLLLEPTLKMINCCNELNGGYAADGYARAHGASALVVTYSVGGLSAINAIAGAYAENLPIIVISGGPNTHSIAESEILHHTLATENYRYVRDMYAHVTAHQVCIHKLFDAPVQIDKAISIALQTKKPVYIEIATNLFRSSVSSPTPRAFNIQHLSDTSALNEAVKAASNKLNLAQKPVIILGSLAKPCHATQAVEALSQKTGYALATMPDAKGKISEKHPHFIGIYWGPVSSQGTAEIVESSDCYLFIGPNFNDYTTVGKVCNIHPEKSIIIKDGTVWVGPNCYTDVFMNDFLRELSKTLRFNDAALNNYIRIKEQIIPINVAKNLNAPILTRFLVQEIQDLLNREKNNYAVIVETGDSWFNGMTLNLSADCPFEIQMQYGSIGWSVGALLGMQAAYSHQKRVVALIGDGSFQMSAQELSTLIRYDYHPIIFLMNNGVYTIEVQIHDGPYNKINSWHYADLVHIFNGPEHRAQSFKVHTCKQLINAIKKAEAAKGLCFIEVIIDKDDCNKHLLEWGARVAQYNSR